jgi:signal transduction histidine kinase
MPGSSLASFILENKAQILSAWAEKVCERLGLDTGMRPQLYDDLPDFLEAVCTALNNPGQTWPSASSATAHGEQRAALGFDIGGLAEEFGMVTETILELAAVSNEDIDTRECVLLIRLLTRGSAESVRAYGRARDRQFEEEAARHFSFIAHELRTPLQAAQVAGRLLTKGVGDLDSHAERLHRAHEQLIELVDNALMGARLRGEPQLDRALHDMHDIVREVIANTQTLAERKGVELDFEGESSEISVDRKLIVSALTNLVVNGIKFTGDGGTVNVRCQSLEDRVLFEVFDGCGGLPDELPAKLFRPFAQAGDDRTGFGLGLVIVKQAVEAHGGAVRVVNDPPRGCCFIVELPKTARDDAPTSAPDSP